MGKVKIVVVEDEIIIADNICETLTDLGYDVAEPAISFSEALDTIEMFMPDLAMLDIRISGKRDGIDLAQIIKEKYNIPTIFLTSNTDANTLERAKKVAPAAYLVKPFSKDELYTSIEIALSNFKNQSYKNDVSTPTALKQALFIKQNQLFIKVKFEDILFIQSDHIYIEIIATDNHKYLIRSSLNDYISKLDNNFIRVHRGYIINIQHIESIDQDYVKIANHSIPIGKNYREEFLSKFDLE